jgi:hypothetical protein
VEELEIPPLEQLQKNLPYRMPKLRVLTLSGDFNIRKFHLGFNYEESESKTVFPALKEVRLEMDFGFPPEEMSWTDLEDFLSEDSFPQVEAIRIRGGNYSMHTLTTLHPIFPHITSLHVHWPHWSTGDYPLIWDLYFLTDLEIQDFSLTKCLAVDSIITGLEQETCLKLRKEPKLEQELIFFRKKDSICKLFRLRRFKLVLSDVPLQEKEVGVLSRVSHLYGFGRMRNLQVVIGYNFRHAGAQRIAKAIEGVRPFVTVVHEELK